MFILMMLACDPEVECSEEQSCEFGSVCVDGSCQEIPCATSDQCGIEEFCEDRQCIRKQNAGTRTSSAKYANKTGT